MKKQVLFLQSTREESAKNIILNILHPSIDIQNNENEIPEIFRIFDEIKCSEYIIDHMARSYSVKASSRRWHVHTFFNMLNLPGINISIIYEEVIGKKQR